MKAVSLEQKKIIYIFIVAILFFLSFWFFIYLPQGKRLTEIKNRLTQTEAEIQEITNITAGKDLALAVRDMGLELIKLKNTLPHEEEMIINYLSEEARKLKLEVKNIKLLDKHTLENKVSRYEIEEVHITMNLGGEFKPIGEYLEILRNNLPVLVKVNQLDIQGRGEGNPNLEVFLQISAYLTKEEK